MAQVKFYQVSYSAEGGNSGGFSWHTSKREAEAAARKAVENDPTEYAEHRSGPPPIEVVEIKPTKADILLTLRTYASHPDNG